jgi:hypothetical protein
MSNQSKSPKWAFLKKTESMETEQYFIDAYQNEKSVAELQKNYLDYAPVIFNFAVFDKENNYLLSYALETRLATDAEDNEYIGYFLETYCKYQSFACKTYRNKPVGYDEVKAKVMEFITQYDAVAKMIAYDLEEYERSGKT